MHLPVTTLVAGTPGSHRGIQARPLEPTREVPVEKPYLAGLNIVGPESRPGLSEEFKAKAAGEIRIFDERDRRLGITAYPVIGVCDESGWLPAEHRRSQEEEEADGHDVDGTSGKKRALPFCLPRIRDSLATC